MGRLVDYTCERQVIINNNNNGDNEEEERYISQDTINGGRYYHENDDNDNDKSSSYVQELAPIPLSITSSIPTLRTNTTLQKKNPTYNTNPTVTPTTTNTNHAPSSNTTKIFDKDIEPMFYTSYSNELLFHLRKLNILSTTNPSTTTATTFKKKILLHDNMIVQVEIRKIIKFNDNNNASYYAIPLNKSSIYNKRRGNYLIPLEYSTMIKQQQQQCDTSNNNNNESCVLASFLNDEFKIKLPLILKQHLCLFFTLLGNNNNNDTSSSSNNDTTNNNKKEDDKNNDNNKYETNNVTSTAPSS